MKKNILTAFFLVAVTFGFSQTEEEFKIIRSHYNSEQSKAVINYLGIENDKRLDRIKLFLDTLSEEERKKIDIVKLRDITEDGKPLYYVSSNNPAAITIRADKLYAAGNDSGIDLRGQNMVAGVWEAEDGYPLRSHLDLMNRITVIDGGSNVSFHATHVTGTIISSGNNYPLNLGRGIAYEATVLAGNSSNDSQEMAIQAANGLLVSNHSYGYGAENLSVATFGAYQTDAFSVDLITYTNPYYLPVISAGNDRDDFFLYNPSKSGYDLLSGQSVAKNCITSAAVGPVMSYTGPSSVVMSSFSNWGPTDDGRIKPDISSQGVNVTSTSNASNTAYGNSSGTSMSAPGITGLLLLLQEHYNNVNSQYMLAATAKGLLLHTADEAGPSDGPDYSFGWGLANGKKAVDAISNNNVSAFIEETALANSSSRSFDVVAAGNEPLMVSISWTDPQGAISSGVANDPTPVLVNDLDLKLTKGTTDYFPWKLDPANPSLGATRNSTNDVDNFEKVEVDAPSVGETYTVTINHKNTLSGGLQNYSLIITGGILSSLGVSESSFDQLSIYPNPNKGQFTISFDSSLNNNSDVKIDIYDISGRLVYKNTFANNSARFNETINLSGVASGVYVANISKGGNVTSQKIIIE
ncbi:S8 family serine peptidase [Winogradskyella sp. PC D3.3]